MRGLDPSHYRACLPKLGKRKNPEGQSGGAEPGTSGARKKASAYPEQPGGILKKGGASKASGAGKDKADPDATKAGPSNRKQVRFDPEPKIKEFGKLEDLFSPRSGSGGEAPRLSRSESMPADMRAAHAANDREPLALPERGARPMTLGEYLAQPMAPSTLSPSESFPDSPRLALPQPPAHLRAGWTDSSSDSSAGSPTGRLSGSPGSPAHRPGRFEGWDSRDASPVATPRAEAQPGLTRTASEVGALFGGEGRESGTPVRHPDPTPASAPVAEGDGRRPAAGVLGTGISGTTLAVGAAAAAAGAILLSGQGADGGVGT